LLVVLLAPSYKHLKEILLYSNSETLSFKDVKANLLSKEKFDLEVRFDDKDEGLLVRGRTSEKEGTSSSNSRSTSKGRKSSKFSKECRKAGH